MDIVLEILSGLWETLCEMAPYLIFGFFMAGVLSVFISTRLVERHLGGSGFEPILKAALFGVPLPLCSCSVIPVASSIRRQGSSKAAATSFLLSTPQTGVDSVLVTYSLLGPVFAVFRPLTAFIVGLIGTIWKTIGRRETLIYLATVVGTALGSGLLLELFFDITALPAVAPARWMPPAWLQQTSAVALLAIITYAIRGEKLRQRYGKIKS